MTIRSISDRSQVFQDIGFAEGVLIGIEMSPGEFRVEAVTEAREALHRVSRALQSIEGNTGGDAGNG